MRAAGGRQSSVSDSRRAHSLAGDSDARKSHERELSPKPSNPGANTSAIRRPRTFFKLSVYSVLISLYEQPHLSTLLTAHHYISSLQQNKRSVHNSGSYPNHTLLSKRHSSANMLDEEVSSDGEKRVILSRSMSIKPAEYGISSFKPAFSKLARNHSPLLLRSKG